MQTLTSDPMLRNQLRLANLVTTIDTLHGSGQIDAHGEAMRQVALADRLVLTKTDIAPELDVAVVRTRVAAVNPAAPVVDTQACDNLWEALLGSDATDPNRMADEALYWLSRLPDEPAPVFALGDDAPVSAHAMRSFSVRVETDVDWTAFAVWLSALIHRHGSRILRIKGLLNVAGFPGPVLLNAVQSFIHPPQHLEVWPDADRSSRLVFIVDGLDPEAIRRSLLHFIEAAAPARSTDRRQLP